MSGLNRNDVFTKDAKGLRASGRMQFALTLDCWGTLNTRSVDEDLRSHASRLGEISMRRNMTQNQIAWEDRQWSLHCGKL